MTSIQKDLALIGTIILINIGITILYRQFESLKAHRGTPSPFANETSFVNISSSSFMPRIPFLIIKNIEKQNRTIAYFHNTLCVIVYAIFIYLMFCQN